MLTYETAKMAQGKRFTLQAEEGPALDVTLVSVQTLDRRNRPDHFRAPFALYFKGTPGVLCQQGLYHMEGAALGRIEIFIVPVERDAETNEFVYQATFN